VHPTAPQDMLFDATERGWRGPERTAATIASHGASVLNLTLQDGEAQGHARWLVAQGGFQSRRVTGDTVCRIAGPAAGSPRLRTADDPDGLLVHGLLAVRDGCRTPWGTVLLAEGNALGLFGDGALAAHEAALWGPATAPPREQRWSTYDPRFDPERTPNEPNRFGWVAELDALDPGEQPVKRTALGRGAHGGVLALATPDGRAVVYLSERRPGGFVYRYVSNGHIDRQDREANDALLNDGVLSVAVRAGTRIAWKKLPVAGEAGLGLIERSRVALAEGASAFDRPVGFAHDARSGRVYLALAGEPGDAARPGRVLELIPPGAGDAPGAGARADHAAAEVTVADFLRAGEDLGDGARFAAPDSLACDAAGRLWIATAQQAGHRVGADTIVTTDLDGPHRGLLQRRYLAPRDAAMGGLGFSPDGGTLFAGVRHPGAGPGALYEVPTTRWPALDPSLPPRSTVIALGGVAR